MQGLEQPSLVNGTSTEGGPGFSKPQAPQKVMRETVTKLVERILVASGFSYRHNGFAVCPTPPRDINVDARMEMNLNQLCQLASDFRGRTLTAGMMAEEMIDGLRAMWFAGRDGKKRLWSRNGIPIEGTAHIQHHLDLMERRAGVPLFIDGEFQVDGTMAASKAWFERGHKFGGEAGVLHIFDVMTFKEWRAGQCEMPLYARKAWLEDLHRAVVEDPALSWEWRPGSRGRDEGATPVIPLPDEWVSGTADAMDMARRIWVRGGEGVVLKDAQAPYERGRNRHWLKLKMDNLHKWSRIAA